MDLEAETVTINGVTYVKADKVDSKPAETLNGLPYVIVRTYSEGVFAGYLASRNGQEVVMKKARRIWKWAGAASLSQLAQSGTSNPSECLFPEEVDEVILTQAIEILTVTEKAKNLIKSVPVWKK